jgi:hypothetical protein
MEIILLSLALLLLVVAVAARMAELVAEMTVVLVVVLALLESLHLVAFLDKATTEVLGFLPLPQTRFTVVAVVDTPPLVETLVLLLAVMGVRATLYLPICDHYLTTLL